MCEKGPRSAAPCTRCLPWASRVLPGGGNAIGDRHLAVDDGVRRIVTVGAGLLRLAAFFWRGIPVGLPDQRAQGRGHEPEDHDEKLYPLVRHLSIPVGLLLSFCRIFPTLSTEGYRSAQGEFRSCGIPRDSAM